MCTERLDRTSGALEGEGEERETKREEAALIKGPLRLYKLIREAARTLKPSETTSYTETHACVTDQEKTTRTNVLVQLQMTWREVSSLS